MSSNDFIAIISQNITVSDQNDVVRSTISFLIVLATNNKQHQAPFSHIASKQSDLIASKYIPLGTKLNDPRAMKRNDMIFFEHIGARQTSHGIRDAFRFKGVLSSRKKGSLHEASYPNLDIPSPAPAQLPTSLRHTVLSKYPACCVVIRIRTAYYLSGE
jgi:hypothetical protein